MALEFCIFDHIDSRGEPVSKLYRDRLAFGTAAEAAGFSAYYVAEHHSTPLGHAASPSVFLAALSQHTSRMRIGSMVHVLPLYDPLRLYEEICMLDHMSEGRLDIGIGRGASPFETGLFGICAQESRDIFEEGLEVLRKAFRSNILSHRGENFRYYDVPLQMRPLQQDGPPLFYGAFSERNLEFAATNGLNISLNGPPPRLRFLRNRYLELWAQYQPDRATPKIASLYQVFVGENDAEGERIAGAAFDSWYKSMIHLWQANNAMPRQSLPDNFATAQRNGIFIAGSAATVRNRLQSILNESGLNRLLIQCNMGQMTHEEALASLRRFGSDVMPHLTAQRDQPIQQLLAS